MFGVDNLIGAAKEYVRELSKSDKELRREVTVRFSQDTLLKKDEQLSFNNYTPF